MFLLDPLEEGALDRTKWKNDIQDVGKARGEENVYTCLHCYPVVKDSLFP